MPDVPNSTIEAEQDFDYSQTLDYSYGILDSTLAAIATAVASTDANSLAVGEVTTTATAAATTDADTLATGDGETTATATPQTTASSTATSAGASAATATATTTAATVATDATSDAAPIEFRVTRDGATVEDAVYDVAPLVDTANPFGDYCVFKIDDRGGEKFEEYGRGTRVDVAVSTNNGITFQNRFTGYVVERRELDQQGADSLEVEAYSFDQFLRRNTVTNDQTGNTITEALEDIITTDTPVSYVSANVEVGDEQDLTRSYQGLAVENALRDLAFKSNDEEFGVNDDLEFFFRPREVTHIDRGIDNTQWFNYDIPELGKEAINEVEVWYNDGEESVIVDDGTDKLDLQDSLALPEPGTQRAELQRPLITDINDAEDIGRKYLAFRNATLSGTVTTFGLYDAQPGDTIDITIDSRGIDTEFVIAAVEYRWGVDETTLTIVENRGDVDDILTELSDSVQRVEMEGANRDAPSNRITTTNARAIVDVTVDADGNTPDGVRFVNAGRNLIRDGWRGAGLPTIDTVAVGDDGTGLSRSNTDLANQTNSANASETLPDATSATYEATITETGVQEVGLFTADGTLVARATFEIAVDVDGTVSVTLDVSNDDSVSRGVLTTDGQTAVRDVLADNAPALPADYAYGSDGTAVAESDTALGNEAVSVSLDEILIQDADTQAEWESIVATTFTDTDAAEIDPTGPTQLQSAFVTEGENATDSSAGTEGDSNASDGVSLILDLDGSFAEYQFTPVYDIPADRVSVYLRIRGDDVGETTFTFNGDELDTLGDGATIQDLIWRDIANDPFTGDGYGGGDLTAGTTYTLRAETTTVPGGGVELDVVALVDNEYTYTFDDDNGGNGGFLDGPQLYPEQTDLKLATASTRRDVTEANFTSSWNDVSNNQFVELANDGSTFTRFNNSDMGSVTFASAERDIDTNIRLSRWSDGTQSTPLLGNRGQQISSWELFANPNAVLSDDIGTTVTRAVVAPNTITGETIREAGLKSGSTLLTRHEIAEFDVLSSQRLASAEQTTFIGDE